MSESIGFILRSNLISRILFDYENLNESLIYDLTKELQIKLIRWLARIHPDNRTRISLYKLTTVKVGKDTVINMNVAIDDNYGSCIKIGERVAIASNVHLIAKSNPNNSLLLKQYGNDLIGLKDEYVHIEDDVWIGSGAIILPGVTVGRGAIIGAGSVVTKNISPGSVVGGIPAKLLVDTTYTLKN